MRRANLPDREIVRAYVAPWVPTRVEDMMSQAETARVAILWRGDHEARKSATPGNNRFP